jgi:asparagine synthase (glutamine-hydrolysing)
MYAQKVADYLETNHHSIVVEEEEFLKAIPQVIHAIESYDTTTVRASVGNWLISKYIKENSDAKVIFNGDGSDELSGGYMYFDYAENKIDFDFECRRLLKDIHYFDVLRSDRSISSHGLEPRTPFLDKTFVENYLRIPADLRYTSHKKGCEKYLIRESFKKRKIIPQEVLYRTKEAFSDGVSSNKKSWYEVIQDYLKETYVPNETDETYSKMHNPPKTLEQKYYRDIFNEKFKNFDKVIPYFWMPKFIDATDASARTLSVYKTKQKSAFRK